MRRARGASSSSQGALIVPSFMIARNVYGDVTVDLDWVADGAGSVAGTRCSTVGLERARKALARDVTLLETSSARRR